MIDKFNIVVEDIFDDSPIVLVGKKDINIDDLEETLKDRLSYRVTDEIINELQTKQLIVKVIDRVGIKCTVEKVQSN